MLPLTTAKSGKLDPLTLYGKRCMDATVHQEQSDRAGGFDA